MARMKKNAVLGMAFEHWESFHAARNRALQLDGWLGGEQYIVDPDDPSSPYHGTPYYPRRDTGGTTDEYDNLASLAPSAFASLIVTSLTQTAHIEGLRMPGAQDNLQVWETFQRNRWNMKQNAVHRAAAGLSAAYGVVMPGIDPFTGDKMPKMRAFSPIEMSAWYSDDDDEWAYFGMRALPYEELQPNGTIKRGWTVQVFDETSMHRMVVEGDGREIKDWTYLDYEDHPMRVAPVARGCNRLDLGGRATGELEPIMPLLRRIDQDIFDRLIVQRFGAWKVRYIAGLAKPDSNQEARLQALRLRVEDLLVSDNAETKFGTLDASDPKVYSDVTDADLRMLSAVTQTPPHHLLGLSSNLQAEALAAAESGLQRKSDEFKLNMGEFHEQMARMCATVSGNAKEAAAWDMQVRWADTESRSLTQAADALGKLATQLNVPVEMMWEKIPGWTDSDVQRAKDLIESGDTVDALLREVVAEEEQRRADLANNDPAAGKDAPPQED